MSQHRFARPVLISAATVSLLAGLLMAQPATKPAADRKTVTKSGLTIIQKDSDASGVVENGDMVWVHYAGRLENGTEFDNSTKHPRTRLEGLNFTIGAGEVIRGWDEGITGMKVGEKRQLIIPPDLAYGDRANGPIPANSTLTFDVELIGLRKAPKR